MASRGGPCGCFTSTVVVEIVLVGGIEPLQITSHRQAIPFMVDWSLPDLKVRLLRLRVQVFPPLKVGVMELWIGRPRGRRLLPFRASVGVFYREY